MSDFSKGLDQIGKLREAVNRLLDEYGCDPIMDFSIILDEDGNPTLDFWFEVTPKAMMSQEEAETHDAFMDIIQGFDLEAEAEEEQSEIDDLLQKMKDEWENEGEE